jgi:hypothetical protein
LSIFCFRPTTSRLAACAIRAPDGKGLIALQYDERFQLGQVDADDVKALRKRVIDAMAKFDMSEVKAWHARGK